MKISIVTPSYNQAQFLEETIHSVLSQNYPSLEYIIIDGGSSDGSVEIIKTYEGKIDFWISEKDEGHGHALNKGFSHTTGEIMAWINSDDLYTPWSFKVVADVFTMFPNVNWIMGFNSVWNIDGAMVKAFRNPKNIYDFLLGNYAWIQQESVFWRRNLWDRAGGFINQNYKLMVDGELWTRFFLFDELYTVDCVLGGYRFYNGNRSSHYSQQCKAEMENAISVLYKNCPKAILKNANKIKLLKKFKFFNKFFKNNSLCTRIGHKNIFYKNNIWEQRVIPFRL